MINLHTRSLLAVLACLLGLGALAQVNVDSLKLVLGRTHRPLERLEVLRQLSKAYDPDVAEAYALATIHYADSLLQHGFAGDSTVGSQRGNGLWNYGVQQVRRGSSDQAVVWYRKAVEQWEAVHDLQGVVFGNSGLAAHVLDAGRPTEALLTLKKNLALHEAWGDPAEMGRDRLLIGSCYLMLGDQPRALENFLLTIQHARQGKVPEIVPPALAQIGLIYNEQGQTDTAIAYYERSIEASEHSPYPGAYVNPSCNLAGILVDRAEHDRALAMVKRALVELGPNEFPEERATLHRQLGIIHRAMGDLDSAVYQGEQSIRYNASIATRALALIELGFTWLRKDRPDKALVYGRRARSLYAITTGPMLDRRYCAQLHYEIFDKTGPADSTLFYYRLQEALDDSVKSNAMRMKLQSIALRQQEVADSLKAAEARHADLVQHERTLTAEKGRKRLFLFIGIGVAILAIGLWARLRRVRSAKRGVERERDRSDNLLMNILPSDVAEELKNTGASQARDIEQVSILFTDFKDFTGMSEQLTAQELVAEINICFRSFDAIIGKHGVEKIKTIGDAYMAAGGFPVPTEGSASYTVLAALEMQEFMKSYAAERTEQGKPAFSMRLGIHTGPVVAGIVGVKKFQYDIWGDTVNTASRMESSGEVGQVNISGSTYALVSGTPGLRFKPRGKVEAKGKGEMEMYFVTWTDAPAALHPL